MMELLATGRKARSRYFSIEQMQRGFGCLILEAQDFRRADRDRITSAIVDAFDAGQLHGETLDLARRIANAMLAPCSTLEALRCQIGADGRELVSKILLVATVVPALRILIDWIGLAA